MKCLFYLLFPIGLLAQLNVETVLPLDASGGVTIGSNGYVYVSDFGKQFGHKDETKVYQVNPANGKFKVFSSGFRGASGACFDRKGNFYQSEPYGGVVTKIATDGKRSTYVSGLKLPVGLVFDSQGALYVCDCGNSEIVKVNEGKSSVFAKDSLIQCPNGMTIDDGDNLYIVNFPRGDLVRITRHGRISVIATVPVLAGGPNPVGNGHLTYKNGFFWVTNIGTGKIYKISPGGTVDHIAGNGAFTNEDGPALEASFSKPNGIAASITGDTMFVNTSTPSWVSNPKELHPGQLRMITGVCGLPDVHCPKNNLELEDYQKLRKSMAEFSKALEKQDWNLIVKAYTSDAKILPGGKKILTGHDQIGEYWTPGPDAKSKTVFHHIMPEELEILNPETAYDFGYYEGISLLGDGKESHWKGKYTIIWKKVNSEWKIYVDIWNRV